MEEEKALIREVLNSEFCERWMRLKMFRVSKSKEASEDMRKYANRLFKTEIHNPGLHEQIWQCYTSCIITAERDSEHLAFGYGNRSAILIHVSKYEECMKDIDRALDITKDNAFRIKLLLRKVKCLHALKLEDECQNTLKKAEFLIGKMKNEGEKKIHQDNLNKTKQILRKPIERNTEAETKKTNSLNNLIEKHQVNDFSSIKIQSNEKYGRHLVAEKDFRPGDVIFVEKPLVQCINLYNMHGFCSHCFKNCFSNIPCDECSWAMFCSEECKNEAWEKYHDIECSVWANAKQPGDCTAQQLALRTFILALNEFTSLEKIKAEMEKIDECTDVEKGFMQDGKIQPNNLNAIFSLSRDISKESFSKIHKEPIIKMLRAIASNTPLFGCGSCNFDYSSASTYKDEERNEAVLFGAIFLRLCKIAQLNGRQIWNNRYYPCLNNPSALTCPLDRQCHSTGSYIAPVTSLINHSCLPNASVCYASNNVVIVYATQSIKKGEQIFDSYTYEFPERKLMAKRQEVHSYMYNFTCDCGLCEKKLSFYASLESAMCNDSSLVAAKLTKKYQQLVKTSFPKYRTDYDDKMINYIRKAVEEVVQKTDKLSGISLCLMFCLQRAYEQIYGISLDMQVECNNI